MVLSLATDINCLQECGLVRFSSINVETSTGGLVLPLCRSCLDSHIADILFVYTAPLNFTVLTNSLPCCSESLQYRSCIVDITVEAWNPLLIYFQHFDQQQPLAAAERTSLVNSQRTIQTTLESPLIWEYHNSRYSSRVETLQAMGIWLGLQYQAYVPSY